MTSDCAICIHISRCIEEWPREYNRRQYYVDELTKMLDAHVLVNH
jgi:hypothetical protein